LEFVEKNMEKEKLIKKLELENQTDLKFLDLNNSEYIKLKKDWLNKETENFEIVCQIELRKQILEELNNF
tara:strand:- start:489 stop:698 length:210 start_codon:yes stop_codon:yes gene_type:complete